MFSGIVEEKATVIAIEHDRDNVHFTLDCSFKDELKIDQSVAHDGVCLTVVKIEDKGYTVTAMKETLDRSNLGEWKVGTKVNVERSMKMNGRLDGHIVQGHVDLTAVCTGIEDNNGSWYFTFEYESGKEMAKRGYLTVDKGSVTVNGVSLTVCDPTDRSFKVSIIPYTYENTDFGELRPGMKVNIEFDIIGKYVARMLDYGVLEKYSGL
ncbi:MAG: riboflavin synthase [Bacteroidetes bacterium]|uniref:Riboflavin synthase n=1 Tax=Candidatus Enterocola intestinipullorum TaxID=2840783 RepID=A0A9D9EFI1_9BACT|nr:riboflavin synthase [Candidatus Enterocola intestinipullorum]